MLDLKTAERRRLACYYKDQVRFVWDRVAPYIQKALDRGSNYTLEDIHQGLIDGGMQLWVWQDEVIHGALVTTIQEKNHTKYCLFLALGGSRMDEWIHHLPIVHDWARQNGCDEMRIYGRIGWAKVTGYDVEYTKMIKEL